MEGVFLTIRKDGSTFGSLEAMVTIAHDNFYSYVPAGGSYRNGQEDIDGTCASRSTAPRTAPPPSRRPIGNGAFAWNGGAFPGGDGVVYFPRLHHR